MFYWVYLFLHHTRVIVLEDRRFTEGYRSPAWRAGRPTTATATEKGGEEMNGLLDSVET